MFKILRQYLIAAGVLVSLLLSTPAKAEQSWPDWVAQLRAEAIAQGIRPILFDQLFKNMQPGTQQLRLDKAQPEKKITFLQYRESRIDKLRIFIGQRECKNNKVLLQKIGKQFYVDPSYVVAIWGVESSYGYFPGNFPVVKSLATLAYRSDRKPFFREQLLVALRILNEGHITPDKFKGEWAGASGMPQFMPTSWYKYAVDFDHDGSKNIWTNKDDALASIANYLKLNGWQYHQPWGVAVTLPVHWDHEELVGLKQTHTLAFWKHHGVVIPPAAEKKLSPNMQASLIEPEGGPNFLVFNNFKVLMTYNNSIYYAASIGYLANKINEECQVDGA